MKGKFGKLGFICLVLIVALAFCGIGYARWSDGVTIEGTITSSLMKGLPSRYKKARGGKTAKVMCVAEESW